MVALSLQTCLQNMESIALTILELLAFEAKKIMVSCDPGLAPMNYKLL